MPNVVVEALEDVVCVVLQREGWRLRRRGCLSLEDKAAGPMPGYGDLGDVIEEEASEALEATGPLPCCGDSDNDVMEEEEEAEGLEGEEEVKALEAGPGCGVPEDDDGMEEEEAIIVAEEAAEQIAMELEVAFVLQEEQRLQLYGAAACPKAAPRLAPRGRMESLCEDGDSSDAPSSAISRSPPNSLFPRWPRPCWTSAAAGHRGSH